MTRVLIFSVITMAGGIGTNELQAQERVEPGLPFYSDSAGWFFTNSQVEEMARDIERLQLLEEKVSVLEELNALQSEQVVREREYRGIYDGLLDDALKAQKRSFWESIPPVVYVGVGALGTAWVLRE